MTLFDFVTVMVSMILALSLGHLLDGISYLYKTRERVNWYLPHTLWMIGLVLTLVHHWWALWDFRALDWNYAHFLYVLIAPVTLSFGANLLAPERSGDQVADLAQQFERVRKPFAIAMLVYVLAMWFDGPLLAGQDVFGPIGLLHIPMLGAFALTFVGRGRTASVLAPCSIIAILFGLVLVRLVASLG